MNGRLCAEEPVRRRPLLRVIFMTGYTRNAIVHNGVLDAGTHLLSKPFTVDQLEAELSARQNVKRRKSVRRRQRLPGKVR
jgi:ActR/RegA family two-component response regulator